MPVGILGILRIAYDWDLFFLRLLRSMASFLLHDTSAYITTPLNSWSPTSSRAESSRLCWLSSRKRCIATLVATRGQGYVAGSSVSYVRTRSTYVHSSRARKAPMRNVASSASLSHHSMIRLAYHIRLPIPRSKHNGHRRGVILVGGSWSGLVCCRYIPFRLPQTSARGGPTREYERPA